MKLLLAQIGSNETVVFAANEIARLIKKMDKNIRLDLRRYTEKVDSVSNAIWIGLDNSVAYSEDDRILVDVKNGEGVISGSNERSVLFSAYRFMTELGCRFLRPGNDGEFVPQRSLEVDDLTVKVDETPSYRHRGICIEGSVGYEHVYNTIEWLPKVAMNSFYFQFFTPTTFFKRYFGDEITNADVDAMMPTFNDEIAKRGLVYHAIGHGWSSAPYGFVASGWEKYEGDISDEMREALALYKGKRGFHNNMPISTQLCYSNPKVIETVSDYAVDFAKKNKNINYLHFSMGDGGRNHCECEKCIKKRPSDHYVDLLNLIDEKMTREGLDTKLVFCAYADTLFAPAHEKLNNSDRFCLQFAPIARSFAHSYDEVDLDNLPETAEFVLNKDMKRDTVELNVAYLKKWQEGYKGDALVFDYQLMWNHHTDPGYYEVAKLISRDIKDLGRMGLNGMLSCQLLRAALPTGLPQYTMVKTLWNKNLSFEEIKNDYFASAFGDNAETVEEYLKKLSDLACPSFVIGETKLEAKEVIDRYTRLKDTVVEFREDYIEKYKDASAEWNYLYSHSLLVPIFADIYISRYKGDEEAVKKHCDDFKYKISELAEATDTVLDDMHLYFSVVTKYLRRHV